MEASDKTIYRNRKFTAADCQKLVYTKIRSQDIKKLSFTILPLEEKYGYLGDHYRINITIKEDTQTITFYCFAKCLPSPESGIDLNLSLGAFKKEIFVYDTVFKKIHNSRIALLKSVVPDCLLTKPTSLLVFEDLQRSGFNQITRYDFLNYDHVMTIIKSLAKLHASSLIYETKSGSSLGRLFEDQDETFYSEKEGHKGTKSLFAALKGLYTEIEIFNFDCAPMTKETFKANLEKACFKLFDLIKPSKKYHNVVCHGDLWQTNFLMKYVNNKPHQAMIVDFQTARYAPPSHDLIAFLYLTTSRIFRKRHFQELLEFYYSELFKNCLSYGINLTSILSFPEFLQSCQEQKLFGSLQAATYFQLTHIKMVAVAKMVQNQKRWEEALYEDHSILILDNYKDDLDYQYRLHESLKDLRDIIEVSDL